MRTLNHTLLVYGKTHDFQYGKRLTRHSEQLCVSQSSRGSLPPPLPFSRSTLLLPPSSLSFPVWKSNATDTTEWKMKRCRGLQSASSALPKSFHLSPQQVVKQKTRSKTKKQKHQTQSGPRRIILLNFLFLLHSLQSDPWGDWLSLITLSTSLKSSLQVLIKGTIEQVNSSPTSTQWSTSSHCFSY